MTGPFISIVTPVYNTDPRILEECISSVIDQTFLNWEMCLVDDCSSNEQTRSVLARASQLDQRLKVQNREINGGIVAASNDALKIARGVYIGLLDHDDVLEPDALLEVAGAIRNNPAIDYLYTDEDLLRDDGKVGEPFRKPDWSPERFRNQMYVCHFSVIRRQLIEKIGGFRPGFDGSQDYDLILRVTENAKVIHHIPEILYHWRVIEGSVAGDPNAKPYAYAAGERALSDHFKRIGIKAEVSASTSIPGNYNILRTPSSKLPRIDMFLQESSEISEVWGRPRLHTEESIRSFSSRSTYPSLRVQALRTTHLDRLEELNRAIFNSNSPLVCISSHRIEVDTPNWCEILQAYFEETDVVAVAPFLWSAGSRLFHAGYNLRPRFVEHAGRGISKDFTGFRAVFRCSREVSAIGCYLALFRRDAFVAVGGFDTSLSSPYAEIDLCLRLRADGGRIIVSPQANAWCFDGSDDFTGARVRYTARFRSKWKRELLRDCFGGLAPENEDFQVFRPKWTPRRLSQSVVRSRMKKIWFFVRMRNGTSRLDSWIHTEN